MKRRWMKQFFGLAIGILLMPAFVADIASAAPVKGGTLVIGSTSVVRNFNGAVQSGTGTALPSTQIFASPLRYDDKWNPQPYLAEKWQVAPDGLSVTLQLVKNALFHDGKPVTSKDVAFTVMAIKKYHPFQTMLAPVTAVDTPDDHTAVIRLSKPHPAILLAMSPALMPILPKHVYDTGEDLKSHPANQKPIGCGPFKLAENVPGEHFILERFDKFFIPNRPYLDKIVVRTIPDPNNTVLSMERGDVDFMFIVVDVRLVERLEKSKDIFVTNKGYEGIGPINWLAFNTKKPPLDDVRVRQAIAYAVDRDFVVNRLMAGKAMPAFGPITPSSPYAAKNLEPYALNIAKAEALLDEAGHKKKADGERFALVLDHEPNVVHQCNFAEYLRPQLKKIGISITVRPAPDFPTWSQRVSNFDFDLTTDTVFNWGDPVIGVARTYLSSNIRKGVIWTNTQQYSNSRVDELLDKAAVELDQAKRTALYAEFQKIVVNEVPIFFVNVVPYHSAFRKGLANLPLTIWGPFSPLDELYWGTGKRP